MPFPLLCWLLIGLLKRLHRKCARKPGKALTDITCLHGYAVERRHDYFDIVAVLARIHYVAKLKNDSYETII